MERRGFFSSFSVKPTGKRMIQGKYSVAVRLRIKGVSSARYLPFRSK